MLQFESDSKYLLEKLEEGENAFQDFKVEINESETIAKAMVAFANQKGGSLFVGVDDVGNVIGCDIHAESHAIQNILDNYCQPKPIVNFYVYDINKHEVLEVEIEEGIHNTICILR